MALRECPERYMTFPASMFLNTAHFNCRVWGITNEYAFMNPSNKKGAGLLKKIFLGILFLVLTVVLFIAIYVLIGIVQAKILIPQNYILWTFKYPVSRLTFIFELELLYLFPLKLFKESGQSKKRHKKWFTPFLLLANLLLVFVLLFNVCAITNDSIINRSFVYPWGRTYSYTDIVSIDTGVYAERKWHFPFIDQSGEFYYTLTLKDGTKLNLNGDAGGTRNDAEINGVLQDIDKTLVNMGIKKTAKTDNFELLEKSLDKVYTDKIKNILTNVK